MIRTAFAASNTASSGSISKARMDVVASVRDQAARSRARRAPSRASISARDNSYRPASSVYQESLKRPASIESESGFQSRYETASGISNTSQNA